MRVVPFVRIGGDNCAVKVTLQFRSVEFSFSNVLIEMLKVRVRDNEATKGGANALLEIVQKNTTRKQLSRK